MVPVIFPPSIKESFNYRRYSSQAGNGWHDIVVRPDSSTARLNRPHCIVKTCVPQPMVRGISSKCTFGGHSHFTSALFWRTLKQGYTNPGRLKSVHLNSNGYYTYHRLQRSDTVYLTTDEHLATSLNACRSPCKKPYIFVRSQSKLKSSTR